MSEKASFAFYFAGLVLFWVGIGQFLSTLVFYPDDISRMMLEIGSMVIGIGFLQMRKAYDA